MASAGAGYTLYPPARPVGYSYTGYLVCLGGLGRYRMAIEDDDVRDREVWTNVASSWFSKAEGKKTDY